MGWFFLYGISVLLSISFWSETRCGGGFQMAQVIRTITSLVFSVYCGTLLIFLKTSVNKKNFVNFFMGLKKFTIYNEKYKIKVLKKDSHL